MFVEIVEALITNRGKIIAALWVTLQSANAESCKLALTGENRFRQDLGQNAHGFIDLLETGELL